MSELRQPTEAEIEKAKALLTCAVLILQARMMLSDTTLDLVGADLERVAREIGFWSQPKRDPKPPS